MSRVLPRLDRDAALSLIAAARAAHDVVSIGMTLPNQTAETTWPPVGNSRFDNSELQELRQALLKLATQHGMPNSARAVAAFDAAAAHLLHSRLDISPHEASQDEAWTYLTCCWLLDVAVWRFGADADQRRLLGDLNRNTFRRLWWRAEILAPQVELARMGEDELVSIMERPTIASDPWFAQTIAIEFLRHVQLYPDVQRMTLMRETTKRLLRRTPFVDFGALDHGDLTSLVRSAFNASAAALNGRRQPVATDAGVASKRAPSPEVFEVQRVTLADTAESRIPAESMQPTRSRGSSTTLTVEQAGLVAVDVALRTGRVTNETLRELLAVTSSEAREILQHSVQEGGLVRRGQKRGTYYTLPEGERDTAETSPIEPDRPLSTPSRTGRDNDTVLRRLLRRGR